VNTLAAIDTPSAITATHIDPRKIPISQITEFIFIGTGLYAATLPDQNKYDIQAVLDLRGRAKTTFPPSIQFKHVPLKDKGRPTPEQVEECFAFIGEAVKQEKRILVHCVAGINRSPAIVAGYLAQRLPYSFTIETAVEFVKEKRRAASGRLTRPTLVGVREYLGDYMNREPEVTAAPAEQAPTTTLVKYDAACRALAEASKVDEAKSIRDKAEAVRVYAKQAKNFDLERQAIEIRLRAERRTGELLKAAKESGHREKQGGDRKSKSPQGILIPKLADLNITARQSSDWQKMAEIPAEEFEAKLTTVAANHGKATTAAILRATAGVNAPTLEEIQTLETAQRLQDACKNAGLNVEISPSRQIGKFHVTYRNLSEAEIQQAIDAAKRRVA